MERYLKEKRTAHPLQPSDSASLYSLKAQYVGFRGEMDLQICNIYNYVLVCSWLPSATLSHTLDL